MEQLRLEKVSKTYDINTNHPVHALKETNLIIHKGDFISISGESGSGKSTLLHLLGCLDAPTSGTIYLNDQPIAAKNDRKCAVIRNEKIGFVLQQFGLVLDETALENVMLPLYFSRKKSPKKAEKALAVLQRVGMGEYAKKRCSKLSGGQKQRVAIARAMVNQPDILLADEPTGALDSVTSQEIFQLLQQLSLEGTTVIIVTHEPALAAKCKRQFTMTDGVLTELPTIRE